jgi:hypothetical protein
MCCRNFEVFVLQVRNNYQKSLLPCPEILEKWLGSTFSKDSTKRIYVLDGFGENWKNRNRDP